MWKLKRWELPALKGKSRLKVGECLSSLEGQKRFQLRKDTANAKSQYQKKYWATNMSYDIYDKAFACLQIIRLVIHQRRIWICIMACVKRILIVEVDMVICHFLYKDNKRKRVDE